MSCRAVRSRADIKARPMLPESGGAVASFTARAARPARHAAF